MAANTSPKWEEIEAAYAEGASDVEIAKLLGITLARFYKLEEEHEGFSILVEKGRTLAQAWWVMQGRKNLWNKSFNTPLYNFQMKNRFGWADKVDNGESGEAGATNLDQAKKSVHEALRNLIKKYPELASGLNLNVKEG